jgi:hypothetical protein
MIHQQISDFSFLIEDRTEYYAGVNDDLHDFRNLSLFLSHQLLFTSLANSSTSSWVASLFAVTSLCT